MDSSWQSLALIAWIWLRYSFMKFPPILFPCYIFPLNLCYWGLVSCIADLHFFLEDFNLAFGPYRILAKLPVFYYEHYDFVGLVVWRFSPILPLSYAGLRYFFFAARWSAVVGFKFTFTIIYVGLFLWAFDACVFSHCAVLSWSKLSVCVLWFVVQHDFLIALLRYGSLFLFFFPKKCKHIMFVDMMI